MRNLIQKSYAKAQGARGRVHDDEEGAGVLEYALVAGVISVALITLASTMGGTVISTATTKLAGVFT